MYDYNYSEDYLMHYGVKGMKWGVRRATSQLATSDTRKRFDSAKADYKQAKKDYNKAWDSAQKYTNRHPIGQFVSKKKKAESDRRWNDAIDKAEVANKAQAKYKKAKAERKTAINSAHNELNKNASRIDKMIYNDATRKKAAKYMVDNNMSMKEANERAKSDAKRNTAVILGAYGAVAVASLYMNK